MPEYGVVITLFGHYKKLASEPGALPEGLLPTLNMTSEKDGCCVNLLLFSSVPTSQTGVKQVTAESSMEAEDGYGGYFSHS